jgi:hypothetical protein
MVILAGMYSGASAARKVRGPMMLPRQKEMRRMAFMVTFEDVSICGTEPGKKRSLEGERRRGMYLFSVTGVIGSDP